MRVSINPLSSPLSPTGGQASMQMMHILQQVLQMLSQMLSMFSPQSGSQGAAPLAAPDFGNQGCCCNAPSNPFQNFLGHPGASSGAFPDGHVAPPSGVPQTSTNPQSAFPNTDQYPGQALPQQGNFGNNQSLPSLGQPGNGQSPFNVDALVSAVSPGRRQAAAQHFPNILAECQRQGVTDRNQVAYILATAVHESNAGSTMEEMASGHAYEGRSSLGNTQPGDGARFKGRGYVQITGRRNYTDWSQRLGMDLVGNPSLATQPAVASRILVEGMMQGTFTGRSLGDYIGNGQADFSNARRVVNGTDRAGHIAGIAQRLLAAMA